MAEMELSPQVGSLDLIAEEPKEKVSESPNPNPSPAVRPLPSLDGWRGLAHYRTESRRNVVKKKPQDRTPSDLYILEESVKNVKLIGDLPLAKRLEICRYLGYEKWDPHLTVYEQGAEGSTFYIMFTGLVRASVHKEGIQEDKVTLMLPGDWFGELALSKENCRMTEATFTTERSELLTLTKKDYEGILKIQKSPEIRERVRFLKSIAAFSEVSKQSLYRLASVLSLRKYTKNRGCGLLLSEGEKKGPQFRTLSLCALLAIDAFYVTCIVKFKFSPRPAVTFQGDEAFEMFFIRTGECRIIMEITSARRPLLRLPRVSTFLYKQSPTRHHKCKAESQNREKDWGRPSLVARFSARMPSQFQSSFDSPAGLGDAILNNPDLLRELAVGHSKVAKSAQQKQRSRLASTHTRASRAGSSSQRPVSLPNSARHNKSPNMLKDSTSTGALSPWGGSPKTVLGSEGFSPRILPRKSHPQPVAIVTSSPRVRALVAEERIIPNLSLERLQEQKQAGPSNEMGIQSPRFKKKEMQERTYQGKRRRTLKPKYTLSKFLSEVEENDKLNREVDFSVKEHALWHMSISQNVMKSAFSEDVKYYRNKFQAWARGVLAREKKLLGFNIYDNEQASPSFTPGAGEGIQKLDQAPGSLFTKKGEGTIILDIGALTSGDYFGERGLLKKSRRAVSIVTITPVEVLVLNVWDFHRHCDRDVIQALAAHDYRKEEQIYRQYLKNCRWERFKKKILDEVLEAKNFRTYMRTGPRAMRYVPKDEGSKVAKRVPNEWK